MSPGVPTRASAAVLLALACVACSSSTAGVPAPAPTPSTTTPSPRQAPTTATTVCDITLDGGSVSVRGSGGRVSTSNGQVSVSCARGPVLQVGPIDDRGVTLTLDGTPTTLAPGAAGEVGPYRVTVVAAAGQRATLHVELPS